MTLLWRTATKLLLSVPIWQNFTLLEQKLPESANMIRKRLPTTIKRSHYPLTKPGHIGKERSSMKPGKTMRMKLPTAIELFEHINVERVQLSKISLGNVDFRAPLISVYEREQAPRIADK